jgi:hypothetical protein
MPIQYAGGTNISQTFTGATRQDIMTNLKAQLLLAGWSNVTAATGAGGPGNVATFTITIATPGVATMASHGFTGGERVVLQTTGALPTGLSVNTVYFIKFIDANTFNLALTSGGANINTTGSQSGTHTLNSESILMQTATTAQSLAIRVRIKDNRGSCVQISIENTAGTLLGTNSTTFGGNLLPAAAKTFRIIANRYQFAVMVPTVFNTARNFVFAGVLYVPAPNTVPAECALMFCDSNSDTSTTVEDSWRTGVTQRTGTIGSFCVMWGANMWESGNNGQGGSNAWSAPNLFLGLSAQAQQIGGVMSTTPTLYRWASGDIITSDPLVAWGLDALGSEPQLRGQIWDCIVVHDSFTGDATTTFDAKNWRILTNSGTGVQTFVPRGSVFLVEP